VGRGGGSIEDLWAFNSEAVVRAVASSELPVISAVGHQTDTTLCDLAADCVAGTPSMAAELAVPDVSAINEKLSNSVSRINRAAQRKLDENRMYLDDRYNALELNSPKNRLERLLSELEIKNNKFINFADAKMKSVQMRLGEGAAKLSALSPLAVLSRGYGYVQTSDGKTVLSVSELSEGDGIDITMADGHAKARIEKVCKN
jgi:exodeoxyribonuclease VII large subunit